MFYTFEPSTRGDAIRTRYPELSAFALSGRAEALRAQIPRVLPWARRRLPFQGALIPIVFRRGGLGVHFPIVFRRMLIHWLATFTP